MKAKLEKSILWENIIKSNSIVEYWERICFKTARKILIRLRYR